MPATFNFIEFVGTAFIMVALGAIGTSIFAIAFIAIPNVSKWAEGDNVNGKMKPSRMGGFFAYLLLIAFVVGYVLYTSIRFHIDKF